jgi:hypothetical protein
VHAEWQRSNTNGKECSSIASVPSRCSVTVGGLACLRKEGARRCAHFRTRHSIDASIEQVMDEACRKAEGYERR